MQDENTGRAAQPHETGGEPGIQGRRLLGNSARSILIGLLAMVPALVLPAVYSRTMPAGDLAVWLYAASIAAWVISFHLGIGPATSALVARVHGNPQAGAAILGTSFVFSVVAAVVASAVLIGLNHAGFFRGNDARLFGSADLQWAIDLAVIGSALVMPLHPVSGYFTGTFQVGRTWPVNLVHKLALTLFGIVAAIVFHASSATAMAHALAGLVTLFMLLSLTIGELRRWGGDTHGATGKAGGAGARNEGGPAAGTVGGAVDSGFRQRAVALMALALPAALSGLAQLPLSGLHAVVIAHHVPSSLVGYSVLVPALSLAGGMIWSVASNLLPELSAAFAGQTAARGRAEAQNRVIANSVAVTGLALVGATAVGALLVPVFLHLSVSKDLLNGHERALGAYAIALTMRQLCLPTSLAFFAIDGQWRGLIPTYLEAVVSVPLAWWLTQWLGMTGLVFAVLAGAWVCALVTPWILTRDRHDRGPAFRQLYRAYWGSLAAGSILALLALADTVPYLWGVSMGGLALLAVLLVFILPPALRGQMQTRIRSLALRGRRAGASGTGAGASDARRADAHGADARRADARRSEVGQADAGRAGDRAQRQRDTRRRRQ